MTKKGGKLTFRRTIRERLNQLQKLKRNPKSQNLRNQKKKRENQLKKKRKLMKLKKSKEFHKLLLVSGSYL